MTVPRVAIVILLVALIGATACGNSPSAESATTQTSEPAATEQAAPTPTGESDELFPDVVGAEAEPAGDGVWTIRATISSPYDSPERYADAWRVVGPDGDVLGVRELAHDHAGEQPFTRSLSGVEIPAATSTVTIEGRDQVNGWGGARFDLMLPS